MKIRLYFFLLSMAVGIIGCSNEEKRFRRVSSEESGITFRNVLHPASEFNILNYMYFYNGGGVALGDFNGDGLPDIYFTSNQEPNKLYLNKGGLKFQDVTEDAGVKGFNGWATGVTTADVNGDGRLDIYVGYLGDYRIYKGKNQLFINDGNDENGVPKFKDRAREYGLDLSGFSTQAAFFDYDRDGDLDMFMLNHSLHEQGTFGRTSLRKKPNALTGDKLLRNDNGHFVDITLQAGIYSSVLGYGLGVAVSDVNLDGWLDIYVGNDFHENDYLYINQQDGTFKETLETSLNHTSRFSMGVDLADFNNDGFPDVISTDMLPEDPGIRKASSAEDTYDIYMFKLGYGYNHQFSRNTLQLNNQDGTFSEIALLAGVPATDWSWSALFADFDLDGSKDLFIANGIPRRPNDLDYINFVQRDSIQRKMTVGLTAQDLVLVEKMPKTKLANYLFVNNHDSTFTNKAKEWGLADESYSNGASYADLDNDGDIDIVINNIEDEAFIYENLTIQKDGRDQQHHFLQFSLQGKSANRFGIGAKIFLYDSGTVQMQECMPTRGYQSAVDYKLTFGLSGDTLVDSVLVIWNDGAYQQIKNVKADQLLTLDQEKAQGNFEYAALHTADPLFRRDTSDVAVPFRHKENRFIEFNREQLIPHMMSSEGPASAVGDLNGDGRDDIFIGGGKWQPPGLFLQTESGKFSRNYQPALMADSTHEDIDAIFFDADNDNDQDLFVVSGGNEFSGKSDFCKPRLYLNDGTGALTRSHGVADVFLVGSCVAAADIDNDGDTDLFLGARTTPWRYGIKPDSYILLNDGRGNFYNATADVAPDLLAFGFVKSATWTDIDGDNDNDLIIAAEWSPITIFVNEGGRLGLLPSKESGLGNSNGWWNFITSADYDQDGDMDLIAGNLGLNSKLKASVDEPVRMYVSDFDRNDSTDQVLTHFMMGKEYPFHTRDEMTKQMPYLKKRFLSYQKFAETDLSQMFDQSQLKGALQYSAYMFETSVIENLGNLKFSVRPLPAAAQFSTVNAIVTDDFDSDGHTDLLLAGNFYPVNIQLGRYDAGFGLVLSGDGAGNFKPLSSLQSGISIKGETRKLRKIIVQGRVYYLAVKNNNKPEAFTLVPQ